MTYKVKDDEIAIIIKPLLRQDGTWNNEVIHTGLYYNTGGAISPGILDDLVKCASLMVCFFDIANEKPELLMEVEERLFNKYGSKFWSEYEEVDDNGEFIEKFKEKPVEKREGNVLYLKPWTKTEGSA